MVVSRGAFGISIAIPDLFMLCVYVFVIFVGAYVFGFVSATVLDYFHRLSFTLMLYLSHLQCLLSVMHGVHCLLGVVCIRRFVCALRVLYELELDSLSILARNRCPFRYHSLTSSHIYACRCALGYHGFCAENTQY